MFRLESTGVTCEDGVLCNAGTRGRLRAGACSHNDAAK